MAAVATVKVGGPGHQGPNTFTAAGNPTVDNDTLNGFRVGDRIIVSALQAFICVDATTGAAVWKQFTT